MYVYVRGYFAQCTHRQSVSVRTYVCAYTFVHTSHNVHTDNVCLWVHTYVCIRSYILCTMHTQTYFVPNHMLHTNTRDENRLECACVYIHATYILHMRTYIHACTYIQMYICIHIYICIYVYTHIYRYIHTPCRMRTYVHIVYIYTYVHMYTRIHSYIWCTYIHMYILYTYTFVYMYTHLPIDMYIHYRHPVEHKSNHLLYI